MPCIKTTSAGERCGSVAWVEGGRVLLGFPGAPGCTTTGVFAESVCCACAGSKNKISGAHTDTSAQKTGAVTPADQIFRLRQHKKSFTALSPHPLRCTHAITKMQEEAWRDASASRKLLERDVKLKIVGIASEMGQLALFLAVSLLRMQESLSLQFSSVSRPTGRSTVPKNILQVQSCAAFDE